MKKFLQFITAAALFLLAPQSDAQQKSCTNEGSEFWATFMTNYNTQNNLLYLFITGTESDSVDVTLGTAAPVPFWITAGQITTVPVPLPLQLNGHRINEPKKGIYVKARHSHHVLVYTLNREVFTTDGSNVLPAEALGTHYRMSGYPDASSNTSPEFAIVATQDSTSVTLIIPVRVSVPSC